MIPEEKKEAVKRALQNAFSVTEFEDIRELNDGLSTARIFRIVVRDKPYLLRVITSTAAVADPTHWFDLMTTAADAGLAPRVWYTNIEDRVVITNFVEAKAFDLGEARIKIPELLRRLHSLPPFPFRLNYLDVVTNFIQKLRDAKVLPESIIAELSGNYANIISIYPRNPEDQVASHNDLKPENFLFDGDRVWLVDWEAAFLNDRYFDLAVVANFVVMNDDDEKEYLKRYFGKDVTEYQLARFFLMRQVLHTSAFTFFMMFGHTPGEQIDITVSKPDFRKFHNGIWDGKISLASSQMRQQYAWAHLEQLRHNLKMKRFDESMRIVSGQLLL